MVMKIRIENVPRLTHCPHIDGLRISTGLVSKFSLSASDVNNAVDNSPNVYRCREFVTWPLNRQSTPGSNHHERFVGETRFSRTGSGFASIEARPRLDPAVAMQSVWISNRVVGGKVCELVSGRTVSLRLWVRYC